MRRTNSMKWLISGLVAFVVALPAIAQESKSAFGPGEQMTFKVDYLGMNAGTTTVTVGSNTTQWGHKVWPLVALAKTESVFRMYPVRDKFISYWDPAENRSIGSDLFADEGNKKRRQRIKVDHGEKKAQVIKQDEGGDEREGFYDVSEKTFDIASAAYALRNMPLEVGSSFELPIFTGAKEFVMTAKVVGKQTLATPMGDKEVFKVAVATAFTGKMAAKRDMHAYFTTDKSHVLVKLEAELVLGTLTANLVEYKEGRQLAATPSNGG